MRIAWKSALLLPLLLGLLAPAPAGGADGPIRPREERIRSGKFLFDARGCSDCHTIQGKGGKNGPDLTRTTVWASPVLGAAIMWNHVPPMAKAREARGMAWPDFRAEEVGDIFTYLHSLNRRQGSAYAFPGEAKLGQILFSATCQKCHGPPFTGGRVGPDLGPKAAEVRTDMEFATRMLLHAPKMAKTAKRLKVVWPNLTGSEMANVLAYIRTLKPKQ